MLLEFLRLRRLVFKVLRTRHTLVMGVLGNFRMARFRIGERREQRQQHAWDQQGTE